MSIHPRTSSSRVTRSILFMYLYIKTISFMEQVQIRMFSSRTHVLIDVAMTSVRILGSGNGLPGPGKYIPQSEALLLTIRRHQ